MSYHNPRVEARINEMSKSNTDEDFSAELEYLHRQEQDYLDGETMAEQLATFCNRMSNDDRASGFINGISCKAHRTLQQSVFGMFLQLTYALAKTEHFDLRNQATIETAKKIVAALGEYGDSLPFI